MKSKRRKTIYVAITVAIIALIACAVLFVNSAASDNSSTSSRLIKSSTYQSIDEVDMSNKRIGVLSGTIFDQVIESRFPDAEVFYYVSYADIFNALYAGKIDYCLGDLPILTSALTSSTQVAYIDDAVIATDIAYVFPKTAMGSALRSEFNEYMENITQSGKLDTLKTKWLTGELLEDAAIDYKSLPATNGVLSFATQLQTPPFGYVKDNQATGIEIEIAYGFCKEYGYGLKINDLAFDGILTGIAAGKYDFAASCISVTPEREESVLFSTPYLTSPGMFAYVATQEDIDGATRKIESVDDLYDARVGCLVGSIGEQLARDVVGPEGEVLVFNTMADLPLALNEGKIDAYINDDSVTRMFLIQYPHHRVVSTTMKAINNAFIFQKNNPNSSKLCLEMNLYLAKLTESGKLTQLQAKWMDTDGKQNITIDRSEGLTGVNGTVSYVLSSSIGMPVCYMQDNEYQGYEVEIVYGFCKEYGYDLQISDAEFIGLLSGTAAGKFDMGGGAVTITAERAENLMFSDVNYAGNMYCVTTDGTINEGFFETIISNAEKALVRENRWKMFLGGVLNTLLITFGALVLGTLLGFFAYLACRNGGGITRRIVNFCSWFVTGMPTVVFLMILFYVVFSQANISGILVSIIGFALIFAAGVVGMLRAGVDAVDPGQEQAAQMLGYSRNQTFYQIILPQAVQHIFPLYEADAVTLLKGTAIVGYIAIQDLTKVGDIVRSRTFEAFFPLALVAILYFVIAAILKRLMRVLAKRFDTRNRKPEDILKGVDTHD